jgi:hypothetical protein
VQGTVTDRAHAPLPGVSVTLAGEPGPADHNRQYGHVQPEPGPRPIHRCLRALRHACGLCRRPRGPASIPNGATLTEAFVLLAFGTLTGLITHASATPATPIVGAQVTAGPASATSDATGRYTLQQLTPGPTTVTVTADGFERAGPTTTSVPEGATLLRTSPLSKPPRRSPARSAPPRTPFRSPARSSTSPARPLGKAAPTARTPSGTSRPA